MCRAKKFCGSLSGSGVIGQGGPADPDPDEEIGLMDGIDRGRGRPAGGWSLEGTIGRSSPSWSVVVVGETCEGALLSSKNRSLGSFHSSAGTCGF